MLNREAKSTIDRINKTFRVLLVTGPRQVGKTTLLTKYKLDNMNYVTLDDEVLRNQAKQNPKMFLEEHKAPLLIDEAQHAPELFPYIKIQVDKENKRGMYWLTGSQQIKLMKNVQESLADRNGEQLNYNNISKEVGINDKTVKVWLDILINSGIIYLLEPFMNTKLKRITHMPKIIFMDSGLCSYLAGWNNARELQLGEKSGHYLETFIISEIIKSYNSSGKELNISYYRDKDKNEIDLIVEKNNIIYPFEIKKTSNPTISMIKNFDKIKDSNKNIGAGGIICCYDKLMHLDDKNYIIPISSVINSSDNN